MAASAEILLVEDDPDDVVLMREALQNGGLPVHLGVAEDGVQALAYLRGQDPFAGAARPDLILLDLNMPRMDGRELLKEIKKDDSLKSIPVIVVTTSDAERDVANCYLLGANCFLTKPVGIEPFNDAVRKTLEFWFSLAKLPPRTA